MSQPDALPEKKFDPEDKWDEMKAIMEADGRNGLLAFIMGFEDSRDQRQLLFFAHVAFNQRDWEGKDLDKITEITQSGIDEMLRQSEAEEDLEKKDRFKNLGNIMSYNLSANLADCWPGDDVPRDERHFQIGLSAAIDCIRWREELKGEPSHFSMAWWAKGMHELSLGRKEASLQSFEEAQKFAIQAAKIEGHETSINAQGHWSVLLSEGYIAIAKCASGTK